MKLAIIDSLYPDFISSVPFDAKSTYEVELQKVMARKFGTWDCYSRNLTALGHQCVDILANHEKLQQMWAEENLSGRGMRGCYILDAQIERYKPDVIFLQDLSIKVDKGSCLIAAQCSCRPPESLPKLDVVFSSLPNLIEGFGSKGIRAVYLPLAFDPSVLSGPQPERIHDVVFIGGVGNPSHWPYGMEVLEAVAANIPTFKWWGYGVETLPAGSALRGKYQGQAYGADMYEILRQSKICLNRHGAVAQGYCNNLRMFEATGCGAMLLTDNAFHLGKFFTDLECVDYQWPSGAVEAIEYWLNEDPEGCRGIAEDGQKRTLRDHTYSQRMPIVAQVLQEMLCPA